MLGFGLMVQGFLGLGFRDLDLRLGVLRLKVRALGLRSRVWGFGLKVGSYSLRRFRVQGFKFGIYQAEGTWRVGGLRVFRV